MSVAVISLNPDLKRLQDEGYELEVCEGCAIIRNVPYLDASGTIQYGNLASPLNMSGDQVKYDGDHKMYFQGTVPYRANGERLDAVFNCMHQGAFGTIKTNIMLSNKPQGNYRNYHEKFARYIQLLTAEAQAIDPNVTAATFRKVAISDESVFCYDDTNASRGAILDVTAKLKGQRVAIVGLGGTGSYILDQVAKTPVAEIHLFDGDVFCQHNAFRAPGAPPIEVFKESPNKAEYFSMLYGNMHRHITAHPYRLDESNVNELAGISFVFLSMDAGVCKKAIVEFLSQHNISFVDTGIHIQRVQDSLIGMTRTTASIGGNMDAAEKYISYAETDNDLYKSNVQTADLNAFCALAAVIQWKKTYGFYIDNAHGNNCVFTTNDGEFKWD